MTTLLIEKTWSAI